MNEQPMQPLYRDPHGVIRFRENAIARYLVDSGRRNLNDIGALSMFSDEDRRQWAQLIGYSLGGYSELHYVSDAAYELAAAHDTQPAGGTVNDYLIWSFEHQAWWERHHHGYTPDLDRAGRYTAEEAGRIVTDSIMGEEVALHEAVVARNGRPTVRALWETPLAAIQERTP